MKEKSSERVFNYIKDQIYTNNWKNGEQITPEIQLAKELNVGRNSVREAIQKFVGLKILTKIRGRGTFVNFANSDLNLNEYIKKSLLEKKDNSSTKKNCLDILEFRVSFDVENIKLFFKNAEEEDHQKLEEVYQKMVQYKDESKNFTFYDAQFHMILALGTKNDIIIKIAEFLSDAMLIHQKEINKILGPKGGIQDHKLILDSIKNRDLDLSIYYIRNHFFSTMKEIEKLIGEK